MSTKNFPVNLYTSGNRKFHKLPIAFGRYWWYNKSGTVGIFVSGRLWVVCIGRRKAKISGGFSLIELIVVIAIMAVLVGVLAPNLIYYVNKARQTKYMVYADNAMTAEKLGVPVVNTFSGCPGGSREDRTPNWVTCPWPEDFFRILEYQWNEVLIPYWKEKVAFAREHHVTKIALELHPGFCVYNTGTLLRLRAEVGPEIGANLDPSHLIWQGMDPVACIRELGRAGALFHFHAKDTGIDPYRTAVNGVLDTAPHGNVTERSWIFRTVGYGHGEDYWKAIISELRLAGYDYAISIEHEDCLMSGKEGIIKAIAFLKDVIIAGET